MEAPLNSLLLLAKTLSLQCIICRWHRHSIQLNVNSWLTAITKDVLKKTLISLISRPEWYNGTQADMH